MPLTGSANLPDTYILEERVFVNRVMLAVLLVYCSGGPLQAIDGLATGARPYRPSYLAAPKQEDGAEDKKQTAEEEGARAPLAPGWNGMFGAYTAPEVSPTAPGETAVTAQGDHIAEMKSVSGSESGSGAPVTRSEPQVHGEIGVTGGAVGQSTYGSVVVESGRTAITVSGERYRSWWP
jgi:hypothetical protein